MLTAEQKKRLEKMLELEQVRADLCRLLKTMVEEGNKKSIELLHKLNSS